MSALEPSEQTFYSKAVFHLNYSRPLSTARIYSDDRRFSERIIRKLNPMYLILNIFSSVTKLSVYSHSAWRQHRSVSPQMDYNRIAWPLCHSHRILRSTFPKILLYYRNTDGSFFIFLLLSNLPEHSQYLLAVQDK